MSLTLQIYEKGSIILPVIYIEQLNSRQGSFKNKDRNEGPYQRRGWGWSPDFPLYLFLIILMLVYLLNTKFTKHQILLYTTIPCKRDRWGNYPLRTPQHTDRHCMLRRSSHILRYWRRSHVGRWTHRDCSWIHWRIAMLQSKVQYYKSVCRVYLETLVQLFFSTFPLFYRIAAKSHTICLKTQNLVQQV